MPQFVKPSTVAVRAFLDEQAQLDFTYPAVGATASTPPADYVVDHTRIRLGDGQREFDAARVALERWDHFRLGWVEALPREKTLAVGGVVAVLVRTWGVWWLNACRIVYLVDEKAEARRRFGFAYGTLPGHAESGEERFLIEWDRAAGGVWYDILAFSQPHHPLACLGYPLARRLQRRFARDSAAAMARAAR